MITGSALGNPQYAAQAAEDFNKRQSGMLTNSGGDFFGTFSLFLCEIQPTDFGSAWEKLPAQSRKLLSSSTLGKLATFPSDWPEVEYLTVAGFMGDNSNYATNGPKDSFMYGTLIAALVAPLSRGAIDISSADMADPPIIDPRWLSDPADQAVAIAAYKRVRQILATKAMAPVLIGSEYYPGLNGTQSDRELLATIRRSFHTVWHASCTCKMGRKDDAMAVVDSTAKVIGVEGLRVVDASSFALLPPGHPVSTICEYTLPFPADSEVADIGRVFWTMANRACITDALAEKIADDIKNTASP